MKIVLLDLGWIICGIDASIPVLWLLVHPFAAFWRRRRSGVRYIGIVWIVLWILLWLISSPWRYVALYRSGWSWLPAVPFWAVALAVGSAGARGLKFWRVIGLPELNPSRRDNQLVASGMHGRLRHPIYLAHVCTMLGWSIGTGSLACWSLTGFAVLAGMMTIRAEERELEQRFGAPYLEYKRRVPMIVPRWK